MSVHGAAEDDACEGSSVRAALEVGAARSSLMSRILLSLTGAVTTGRGSTARLVMVLQGVGTSVGGSTARSVVVLLGKERRFVPQGGESKAASGAVLRTRRPLSWDVVGPLGVVGDWPVVEERFPCG